MVKKADRPQHIIKTALSLAAEIPWSSINLRDIAHAANISPAEMYTLYPSKVSILKSYISSVDTTVLETNFGFEADDSQRDRLFEVLMRRFDILSGDRKGVLSIMDAVRCDPVSVLCLSGVLRNSMRWMLEASAIPISGPSGHLTVNGLITLWLATSYAWQRDESEDMTRTMATLDKNLRRAERIRSMLPSGQNKRRSEDPNPDATTA